MRRRERDFSCFFFFRCVQRNFSSSHQGGGVHRVFFFSFSLRPSYPTFTKITRGTFFSLVYILKFGFQLLLACFLSSKISLQVSVSVFILHSLPSRDMVVGCSVQQRRLSLCDDRFKARRSAKPDALNCNSMTRVIGTASAPANLVEGNRKMPVPNY